MNQLFERTEIAPSVFFSSVTDTKFMHNNISVNFILPRDEKKSTVNAVLPLIMRMGFGSCPDFTELERTLCRLYGAALDAGVSARGPYQILNFGVMSIDDRFAAEGENVSEGCAALLADMVLSPKTDNGAFDKKAFILEKRYLIDTINAELNDKRALALRRCREAMFAGKRAAVPKYGYISQASHLTPKSAYRRWEEIMESAPIEIIFTGCGSPKLSKELFARRFSQIKRKPEPMVREDYIQKADKVTKITESMEINQSKLVMGFRISGDMTDPKKFAAARVMAAILGSAPFSRLFANVREKLGLCYYCQIRMDVSTSSVFIDSGIDISKSESAQEAILAQIEDIALRGVTQSELEDAKRYIIGAIRGVGDGLLRLENWYLSRIIFGRVFSPEEDIKLIESVTAEQVSEAAAAMSQDTVYLLAQRHGEGSCDD